jgi:hypothetical protein
MPPPFPKRKLSITSPLSSAKKPQTHQNQNQIPTQLQFPAKWINLSCAFDSFFEAITAQFARQPRLLVNPSSHDEIIGNMSMYGNPPFETFEKCLANMIPYRLSSKVQFLDIKVAFHIKTNILFGKNIHPPGISGSVHHWVKLLETTNDPDMSLFLIKETERLKCPTHGISEKDVIGSKAIVPLSPSKTFVENIQRRFAADRTITCSIHENGNTCGDPTLTTPLLFSAPPMLILDYEGNYGYPVQFIDLMIMGFEYELVAIYQIKVISLLMSSTRTGTNMMASALGFSKFKSKMG